MPWAVAGAVAAASLGGSFLSANAQKSAASQEQQAQEQALAFQERVYGTTVANLKPYLTTGTDALSSLSSLYGLSSPGNGAAGSGAQQAFTNFTQTPAYTFALSQGDLGTNRALAAEGLNASGAQAKAITQYNQGYASSGFQGYINQLASLAGMGQNAAALEGSQGNTAASGVGNYLGAIGAAGAAGTVGAANSLNSGLGGALGALGYGLNSGSTQTIGSSSYYPQQYDSLSNVPGIDSGSINGG